MAMVLESRITLYFTLLMDLMTLEGLGYLLKGNGRRRESRQHCRSRDERRILDARLTEYSVEGSTITGGALDPDVGELH
jgi:hypothetical protein